MDGICLCRNWGGEYENVAVLVAIAVNEDGFREVLGAAEGMEEDKATSSTCEAAYPVFTFASRSWADGIC